MDESTTEEHLDQTALESTEPAETEEAPVQESETLSETDEGWLASQEAEDSEPVKSDSEEADEEDVVDTPAPSPATDVFSTKSGRGRRVLTIVAAVLGVGLLLALAGVAYATYDFKSEYDGRLLPGTVVAGVDVSGMSKAEAKKAVAKSLRPDMTRTISVRFGDKEWDVTPRELGARTSARRAVNQAMEASESASWVELASIRLLDDELDVEEGVGISYPKKGAQAFISDLSKEVNAEPRDAELDYSSGWVEIKKERVGYRLREKASTKALLASVRGDAHAADLEVKEIKPEVTAASFGQVLLLRQSDFTLYMYENGKIAREWPVAVGTGGYPTPTGEYTVELLRYMPTWINPDPTGWGADMPAMIPPGPGNPLGVRAINWTAPGIRFHGTSATSSIGTAASHGCVRMYNEDVIELYDVVKVGTPIISIYG
jgi:hypothetical protein